MTKLHDLLKYHAKEKVKNYSHSTKRKKRILVAFIVTVVCIPCLILLWLLNGLQNDYREYIYIPNPVTIDGDTIIGDNKIIRIDGINAPEIEQECIVSDAKWSCGLSSKEFLQNVIAQYKIFCKTNIIKYNIEKQELYLSYCYIDDDKKTDLGKYIIQNGFAVAYKKYSNAYITDELIAKNNRVGIWNSVFEDPHDFKIRKFKNKNTQI